MKKHFIIVTTLLLNLYTGFGQTNVYHPFPENNAVWNAGYSWLCMTYPYDAGGRNYSITFSNDTVIGSQTYHKLITPFMPAFASSCWSGGSISNVYKGAIRQDSSLKKVFIIPPYSNSEQLLYDFTMQVGDTVKGYIETSALDIVQSIDSVLVGSSYRKRWLINFSYQIYFIEGIGSTYGLTEHSPSSMTDQLMYVVNCFQQNGQPLYPSTTTNCELITSINSTENKTFKISFYPSPANENITIETTDISKEQTITIYNMQGQLLLQQPMPQPKTEIDLSKVAKGVYLIKLSTSDGIAVRKFIKE